VTFSADQNAVNSAILALLIETRALLIQNSNDGPIGTMEASGSGLSSCDVQFLMSLAAQHCRCDMSQVVEGPEGAPLNKEKVRILGRLKDFNAKDCSVWREITGRFGRNIKQPELLSIASVLAGHANIKLDRDARRRKTVLVKWFEENWPALQPYLDYVVLEDRGRIQM
jgi:hypothetical protein